MSELPVYVFAYDRYETMSTPRLLSAEGIDHTVLCHTEEAKEKFIQHYTADPANLYVTGQPKGLANNRNAALEMMEEGEWAVFLVDDLKRVTCVENYFDRTDHRLGITMENQSTISPGTRTPMPMRDFLRAAQETIAVCEATGAHLGGFSGIDNPVFRDAKWRFNVLADGRAWVVKKGDLRFDTNAQLIDDMCWTAQNIQRHEVVVVNQWVLPDCKRYTAGGFGSIEERLPQKSKEASYLVETYPGLVRFGEKKGWPSGTHVQLRRTLKREQIADLERAAVSVGNAFNDKNVTNITTL